LGSGALVPILEDCEPPSYPVCAVTTRSRQMAATAEAIIDFLVELCESVRELRIK
jgi:DNA-binding transcriptional LysR family regulator